MIRLGHSAEGWLLMERARLHGPAFDTRDALDHIARNSFHDISLHMTRETILVVMYFAQRRKA